MNAYDVIRKKRDGLTLAESELEFLIDGFCRGRIPDYQISAFLMAVLLRGMTLEETAHLTRIMIRSGWVFRFDGLPGPILDKHSTGGVGDKISIALVPIAAECGCYVPMISGRSLGHTGGTLDKLESIPGMRTDLSPREFERLVRENGACFSGQTEAIVPADRKLYALRDATATVESIPLIVSSVLSKKLAEGIQGVVIDVKCGCGAFMRELEEARKLAEALEAVGLAMEITVKTVITAMDEPLGRAVGNALEIEEAIQILEGTGPDDVTTLTHRLAAEMLVLGGLAANVGEGDAKSRESVASGRALERFKKIIAAQGGRLDWSRADRGLPQSKVVTYFESTAEGYLASIGARSVGEAVREMGGGRFRTGDAVDPSVGIVFLKKRGDEVAPGEPIARIHTASDDSADACEARLAAATSFTRHRPAETRLVLT
jgi:pyrimidine-nucleoside phosphorylase